ncbi:hypothetical protein NDU88_002972 [Pleurodeles waltl]|uniref:Uncharacterized protein n=1 Tax=Pleurodeles waltl TaxID=8319 RepID=A0AAV7LFB9_PLEWA|nr:hypothetical protein NDU88_002972 [Pleurodeles waltl]
MRHRMASGTTVEAHRAYRITATRSDSRRTELDRRYTLRQLCSPLHAAAASPAPLYRARPERLKTELPLHATAALLLRCTELDRACRLHAKTDLPPQTAV